MSERESGLAIADVDAYQFDQVAPVQGYDPNAEGWKRPPIGEHVYEVVGEQTELLIDKRQRWEGQEYVLNQLKVQLRLVEGPPEHLGATIKDYLPVPTTGREMAGGQANKWANFIKAFGFPPPAGAFAPAGFRFGHLGGRRAYVTVVGRTKKDPATNKPVPDLGDDGQQKLEVKFFGYRMTESTERALRAQGWTPARPTPAASAPSASPGAPVAAAPTPPAADPLDNI